VEAVNVTPAYLFRKVGDEAGLPTILYDEIDTVFGPKAKDNEEIRGLLNAGHRRGAVAGRCVVKGKIVETEEIPAFCAVALAGLGGLPDTLLSRSVIVRMKRRAPNERIQPFRRRIHQAEGHALRDALAAWGNVAALSLASSWPTLPDSVVDRNADIWEPLIAIADAAGGEWPERGRCSAVALVAASMAGTPSLGVRLLSDLRTILGEADALPTAEILSALHKIEDAPWGEMRGKPIDNRGLAQRLKKYDVSSTNIRTGDKVVKGYQRADFADAFDRYLSPLEVTALQDNDLGAPTRAAATAATPLQAPAGERFGPAAVGSPALEAYAAVQPRAVAQADATALEPDCNRPGGKWSDLLFEDEDNHCVVCGLVAERFNDVGAPFCNRCWSAARHYEALGHPLAEALRLARDASVAEVTA
jgi:hypothetical protein